MLGFSVEASAEFYIISSNYIGKRSQLLKEMMDRYEIYSNKKPPTPPKKMPQNSHFAEKKLETC
jgi:hypothetical protein